MRRVPFVINIFNEFSIEMQLVCTKGQKYEFFRVGGVCVQRPMYREARGKHGVSTSML